MFDRSDTVGSSSDYETGGGDGRRSPYSCLLYRVVNLGDMIQTLALSRLLPPTNGVFRHAMDRTKPGQTLVVNGFFDRNPPPRTRRTTIFAGISGPYWYKQKYYAWLGSSSAPIGARDPKTAELLSRNGLSTEMIGCATMTFPKYSGPRKGIFSVDYSGPGVFLSHKIARSMNVVEQWELATKYLDYYRTAETVYTSRLHVAIPCLAMGTPVFVASPDRAPLRERFTLLDEIGVKYDQICSIDLSAWASRYREFLGCQLGIPITEREPVLPSLCEPDRLHATETIQMARFDTQSWVSSQLSSIWHTFASANKK